MSYQVLARKWRPKKFSELVGQEHVVRALGNALATGRTHHAYLFTGTRGVGKTTIARIFAKSINCERNQPPEPCGECAVCTAVDEGRFVDLLEIDAASNTGVDDVRELIENAQYAPSRGRYKVYLIDEVHMLSKSAFNALLKTLEEPPPHVKFLLATTDPQKLPMTVLSRCLKFNLKRLLPDQISGQMRHILGAEGIAFEDAAVEALARAADGSLRDGLSLLDQALAYGGGALETAPTQAMLGSVAQGDVVALLDALAAGDGKRLLDEVARVAEFAPDFAGALDQIADALHAIQLIQLVPGYVPDDKAEAFAALAARLDPEEVQLWYQFAGVGRRDLALAPDARSGFEMSLLRMLAFRPVDGGADRRVASVAPAGSSSRPNAGASRDDRASHGSAPAPNPAPPAGSNPPQPKPAGVRDPAAGSVTVTDPADWRRLVEHAGFTGLAGQLAQNAVLQSIAGQHWTLALRPEHMHLVIDSVVTDLVEAIAAHTGERVRLQFVGSGEVTDTVAARRARDQADRRAEAERTLNADPMVRRMQDEFGATMVPESIRHED